MRLQTDKHKIPAISPAVSEFVSRYFLVRDALGRSACGKRAKIKELPSSQSDEVRCASLPPFSESYADSNIRSTLLLAVHMN